MSHILIAYERESEQNALTQLLTSRGHTVVRSANGLEALEIARRDPPEVVVSDVVLPRLDGIGLCRKWKQDERLQSIPFVFYSRRYDDPKYERFAMELGTEKFLPRSVRPESLLSVIDEVVAQAPARETPAPQPTFDVSAMSRSQALVREQQLRAQLSELEATAQRHAAGEAQFRGLFEDNPLPLMIVDHATRGFIAVNGAALEFYGYKRAEFLALAQPTLIATQVREGDDTVWHVRKDGKRAPVVVASTEIRFEGRTAELMCVQEITAHTQELQSLQAQIKLQRNLLDALPTAWCLIDGSGHVLDVNDVYCRMSGYGRDELLRKSLADLEVNGGTSETEYEAQHRRRDGAIYPVDVRVTPLRDAAGSETSARLLLIQEPSPRALALLTAQHRAQREANEFAQLAVGMLEQHEPCAKGSSARVAKLASEIARELGLSAKQCERVRLAGLLHDIGLIGIPQSLLMKPAALTDAEMSLVRTHAAAGAEMLSKLQDSQIAEIVHQHHERVNGSGYPRALTGEAISIEARVLAVADVFEAMCSARPHRPALGMDAALKEIESNAGVLYDGKVANAALRVIRKDSFDLDAAA